MAGWATRVSVQDTEAKGIRNSVMFYTGSAPPPPPEVHAWIDCSRMMALFFESWGSPGRRNLGSRSRSLGMGF